MSLSSGSTPTGNGATTPGILNDGDLRLVMNMISRAGLAQMFMDPRRSVADECGYPKEPLSASQYQELYENDPIACRVVQCLSNECWQVNPSVYERDKGVRLTPFEKRFAQLPRLLRGESSWYEGEEGNPIWDVARRADVMSRIGRYGIIYLGINDGLDPEQSADFGKIGTGTVDLKFMRVYPESQAAVSAWQTDKGNERYAMPTEYTLTTMKVDGGKLDGLGSLGMPTDSLKVHWSRVLHICEDHLYHLPALQQPYKRIHDLDKLYGGSAEMYWKGALMGLALETPPGLGTQVKIDFDALKQMMEDFQHGLQRWIALKGLMAKSLAPQVVDPTPQILVQLEAICIQIGIPKRIFMGSERGELASSQDDAAWNDRLKLRHNNYLTPRLIVPLVDRLILLGVLPRPKSYKVWWPDLTSQSESEKAKIATMYVKALTDFIAKDGQSMMTPVRFYTDIFGWSEDDAEAVVEEATEAQEEQLIDDLLAKQEQLAQAQAMQDQGLLPGPQDAGQQGGQQPPNGQAQQGGQPAGGIPQPSLNTAAV